MRSAMERRVGDSFEVVAAALERRGAARNLIDLAHRAIDDEYRHEELSRVVASRYAGRDLPRAEHVGKQEYGDERHYDEIEIPQAPPRQSLCVDLQRLVLVFPHAHL
jgi:hypothetical protein